MAISRRDFLTSLAIAIGQARGATGAALSFRDPKRVALPFRDSEELALLQGPAAGQFVRRMPLGRFDGLPVPPFGTLLGTGLDARQFTDTSTLTPETLVTPTDQFFIRTSASAAHARNAPWTVGIGGGVRPPVTVSIEELVKNARAMGTHLMECSGNVDPANFGLISAARWSGVPIAMLLDRAAPAPGASLVRVTGLDDDTRPSQSSTAGASWIFSRDQLERAGAFLATAMNDAALTPDHGAPVRLVVPNWYGCACIKWLTHIDLVADDEVPTGQMREFAARIHQNGVPPVAREFAPATIELAAMPIRVEKWMVDGRVRYRVTGVRWGGTAPTRDLTIRFRHTEPFVPVEDCPVPATTTTWSLWSHTWQPAQPGRYQIALGRSDRSIPARRLEMFYYTREVEIDQI